MSQSIDRSLLFTDGFSFQNNSIVIPAVLKAFPNDDFSRVAFNFDSEWVVHDVENKI